MPSREVRNCEHWHCFVEIRCAHRDCYVYAGTVWFLLVQWLVYRVRDSDVSEVMDRQERTHANMEASDFVDTKRVSTWAQLSAGFSVFSSLPCSCYPATCQICIGMQALVMVQCKFDVIHYKWIAHVDIINQWNQVFFWSYRIVSNCFLIGGISPRLIRYKYSVI